MSMSMAVTVGGSSRFRCCRTQTHCSDSSARRGFESKESQIQKPTKISTSREDGMSSRPKAQLRKSTDRKLGPRPSQAPGLSAKFAEKPSVSHDSDFEERLKAIRRTALQQKEEEEKKEFGPIDYDAPVESNGKAIGLGTKGDHFLIFLNSSASDNQSDTAVVDKKLSEEEKAALQSRLQQFEETLRTYPKDTTALEGAAVTLAELGEYAQATSLLQDLAKVKNNDPEVFHLLGEVKYEMKDYDGSATAYKLSAMVAKNIDFDVLRGLTNALLAAKKPDEAVNFLLDAREHLSKERSDSSNTQDGSKAFESESGNVDLVQVDFLLGKAYSDWGHVSDAVAVYDQLISSNPNDFRGYLAKGIILKENGNVGDAERMFIQARFFAPDKAKALVDRYSRQ